MEKEIINEALDVRQRLMRSRLMKKMAAKLQRKKKVAAKRMADTDTLMDRAKKAAKNILRKKVAGDKGEDYANLATAQKIQIDKLVDKKAAAIPKIAKKLLPKIRKAEIARLKAARSESAFDWETDPIVVEVFYKYLDDILEEIELTEYQHPIKKGVPKYALIIEKKVIAVGNKNDMLELSTKSGGHVRLTNSKVGDNIAKVN
jgi:hypothetical protein